MTPIRFFHKPTGIRVEAAKTKDYCCGDEDDRCKCAFFNNNCAGICFDVEAHLGYNVYFKTVSDEGR